MVNLEQKLVYSVVLFDFLSRCSNYCTPYFYFEPKHTLTLLDVPKWQLLGAMCGVPYIVIMVLAVQRIGAAVATVAVIFGQLLMSILIDNFGWFGNEMLSFSPYRLGALICLGIALYFIYSSSMDKKIEA